MKYSIYYSTLEAFHCFIVFLFVSSATYAQIRIESTVNISNDKKQRILSLLEDVHDHSGKCSKLNVEKAFLADFVEIADYTNVVWRQYNSKSKWNSSYIRI